MTCVLMTCLSHTVVRRTNTSPAEFFAFRNWLHSASVSRVLQRDWKVGEEDEADEAGTLPADSLNTKPIQRKT